MEQEIKASTKKRSIRQKVMDEIIEEREEAVEVDYLTVE